MSETKKIAAGQFVYLSTGSYSDYYVQGAARALRDFELPEVEKRWSDYKLREGGELAFLPWAIREGLLEEVDAVEIHEDSKYDWGAKKVKAYTLN